MSRAGSDGRSHRAPVASRWACRGSLVGWGVVLVALLFGASPALAALQFPFDGSLVPSGGSFGALANSVAVDDANGSAYLADSNSGVVDVFDSTGAQVTTWTGGGCQPGNAAAACSTPAGSFGGGIVYVAADNSSGDVFVLDANDDVVDEFSSSGAYVCQITGLGSASASASECDKSAAGPGAFGTPSGIAVDQATGDVYVLDRGSGVVDVFTSAGAYAGRQISLGRVPTGFSGGTAGLAVSALNGHVYVSDSGPRLVYEFDGSGSYVTTWTGGSCQAGSAGASCATPAGSFGNGFLSVAADDATGRVYVTDQSDGVTDVFDASGDYLAQFSHSYGFATGTAVDQASGKVYVSDPGSGVVDILGPAQILPDVNAGQPTNVGQTSATLTGTVNPDGLPMSDCRFEIGSTWETPAGEQSVPCAPSAASILAGSGPQVVSANVPGLGPGRSYHFRLIAANTNGTNTTPWAGFQTAQSTVAPSCPNAQFRTGDSANLPDCRAYESVTPADIPDGAITSSVYAWPDGLHVFYLALTPLLPNAESGNVQFLLATRTPGGWQSTAISPPQGPGKLLGADGSAIAPIAFTSDFSAAFFNNPFDDDPLDQDNKGMDVYRFDLATGAVSLFSRPDTGPITPAMLGPAQNFTAPPGAWMSGASADGSRVFFEVNGQLPVAPGTTADTHSSSSGDELYERYNNHTYLVGILPDGSVPACGANIANGVAHSSNTTSSLTYGAVAPDGSNLVFDANDCSSNSLYLRDLVHGTTVLLPGVPTGDIRGGFVGRTADGAKIFIYDASNGQFAEYDIASGALTDIGAGRLLASSGDGARVYYEGAGNALYLWDHGTTTMIPGTDAGGYDPTHAVNPRVHTEPDIPVTTADGSSFEFVDTDRLTAYDNQGHQEAYLYRAASNSVVCLSCSPSGEPPDSDLTRSQNDAQLLDPQRVQANPLLSATEPFVSDDGTRAVFETTDTLLPQDHNPNQPADADSGMDVYEWEADGTGSCQSTSENGGCLYLLSSGRAGEASYLAGASAELHDVYIITFDQLLPGMNMALHVYDARVDGGFPAAVSAVPCAGDACQGAVVGAPGLPTAASVSFAGPGNASPGSSPALAGRVRVVQESVRGSRFVVAVRVPGAGRIVVGGAEVRTVAKSVSRAGTYRITVRLTRRAQSALKHRQRLKAMVTVRYTPPGGAASAARLTVQMSEREGGRR